MANLYFIAGAALLVLAVLYAIFGRRKPVELSRGKPTKFPLIKKWDEIAPTVGMHTMVFRFGLPSESDTLHLPIGQHISVAKDATTSRQYTPVTSEETKGYFDLMIKVYPQGAMGNHLKDMPLGTLVPFKGPFGGLTYEGQGVFNIRRTSAETGSVVMKKYKVSSLGMLAGGTGITPMLQIVRYVSRHPEDSLAMSLVFGNQTEGDIMCRKELQGLAESNPNFKLWFMVDRPPAGPWAFGSGFITKDVIAKRLPAPGPGTLVVLCGPDPMCKALERVLGELGYTEDMLFKY